MIELGAQVKTTITHEVNSDMLHTALGALREDSVSMIELGAQFINNEKNNYCSDMC